MLYYVRGVNSTNNIYYNEENTHAIVKSLRPGGGGGGGGGCHKRIFIFVGGLLWNLVQMQTKSGLI